MIKAERLTKDYGPNRAVDQVQFKICPGDVLGFLGPNGAGKSTTMKMLTGFLPPTSGTAVIGGCDIRDNPIEAKRLMGYLPENGPLYGEMTVLEFLRFAAEIRGLGGGAARRALDRVLEICHLHAVRHKTIETLSKGFRQRVGMGQAVIHDPQYLIMDEPTDGLDPNQKVEVRKLIASMGRDKAVVLSTHILEEVEAMCNRVIIIARGRLIADESPAALLRRHPHYNAVKLSVAGGEHLAVGERVAAIPDVSRVEELSPGRWLVAPRNTASIKEKIWEAACANQWPVTELENVPVRLEEVFRQLTGDGETFPSPIQPGGGAEGNKPEPDSVAV